MKLSDKKYYFYNWRYGILSFFGLGLVVAIYVAIVDVYHFLHPLPLCSSLTTADHASPGYAGCILSQPQITPTWWEVLYPTVGLLVLVAFGCIFLYCLGLVIELIKRD